MKLSKKQLDIKNGIEKEWIITNGIGGYASSTVIQYIFSERKTHYAMES